MVNISQKNQTSFSRSHNENDNGRKVKLGLSVTRTTVLSTSPYQLSLLSGHQPLNSTQPAVDHVFLRKCMGCDNLVHH